MITRENLTEVIKSLSDKDKRRLRNNDKWEFCVLYLHVFNAGYAVTMRLTNNYNRYQNVSANGDAILNAGNVLEILEDN